MMGEGQRGGELGGGGFYQSSSWSIKSSMRVTPSQSFLNCRRVVSRQPRGPLQLWVGIPSARASGAAGVTRVPSDGRTLDALSSGIPRSEATFPHRAAKLQAAPERLITADKHPPERRSAPTRHRSQSCNHRLHTNLPNCTQKLSRLRQLWTSGSWNIHQQKFTRNAPRLVSNFKLV